MKIRILNKIITLLSSGYNKTENYGSIDIRSNHTARGLDGLSPWNDSRYLNSIAQLNLGSNSMSKLEVVSMLNINNISTHYLHHNVTNCTNKYNPTIHLGTKVSYAWRWIYDSDEEDVPKHPSTHWPES